MTSTATEPRTSPDAAATSETASATELPAPGDEVLADLLVEEISIDGMCGVY